MDLVLPGAVPVAELVPELARSVGLLDAATAQGGYRLVVRDGRVLATDSGLVIQGVEDGAVITVATGVLAQPPRVYDDLVEVVTEVVERELAPWDTAAGRRTGMCGAVAMLTLGAAALMTRHGSDAAATAACIEAVLLVLAAVALSRMRGETDAAVTVALVGCGQAAVGGLMLGWGTPFFGTPIAAAGGAALVAGLTAALGLAQRRSLLLPPVVVGGVFLATGTVVRTSSYGAPIVLTTVLTLVVIAGSVFPWLALEATGISVDELLSTPDPTKDPGGFDPERVGADAMLAHEILVAMSVTVGGLVVLVSPLAVSLGPAGTVVSVLGSAVVMLRTRHYRALAEVLVGLTSGFLGLLATATAVLLLHPGWRSGAAVSVVVSGAVLLAFTLLAPGTSIRLGRIGDVAETVALLALLPALVVATGVLSSIQA